MGSRISTLLLGIGVGLGCGIMLAPRSGKKTRDALRTRAKAGVGYVGQRGVEVADRAADLMKRGQRVMQDHKETLTGVTDAIASHL